MSITRQLIKHVRDLAEANPHFVYQKPIDPDSNGVGCRYEVDGEGSCIIGQAAIKAGVPVELLRKWDNPRGNYDSSSIGVVADTIEIEGMRPIAWLGDVQRHQDAGKSWGEAVRRADITVTLFNAKDYL